GDAALREAARGVWPHHYDLARVWQEWRGVPLPFGGWIVRDEAARVHSRTVRAYARHLREALRSFFAAPDARLDAWERAFGLPLSRADALDFFSTADYVLTPGHERALREYFGLCAEAGLLEQVPELRWLEG